MQVVGHWHDFELRPFAEVPRRVIRQATKDSITWDALRWGIVASEHLALLDRAPIRRIRALFEEWQADSDITAAQVAQLINLIKAHPGELEADLIREGLRLRDFPSERCTWRDLLVLVEHPLPDSKVYAAMEPDSAGWTRETMLLADIADALIWLQWAKTRRAADGGTPPDRIPRPGVKKREVRQGSQVKPMRLSRVNELAGHKDISREERQQKLAKIARK